MRVFMLPRSFGNERTITVSGKHYHYLIQVLRYDVGTVFPGRAVDGSLWQLLITGINHKDRSCSLTCSPASEHAEGFSTSLPEDNDLPEIHLYQSLLKGKKLDVLIRQLVEIGIQRFIPVQTTYSIPQLLEKESSSKHNRWCQIRDEAIQQSGSSIITEIERPMSFDQMLEDWNRRGLGIFFHHEILEQKSLNRIISEHGNRNLPVALVIGCEGGLSDGEVERLRNCDFKPAFLRTNILRAETAALYASACTQMILQEMA
jgi:16S rRNA (uracil1498-N3)-methyltransferase